MNEARRSAQANGDSGPGRSGSASPGTARAECATAPEARIEILSQPVLLAPLRAFVTTVAERLGFDEIAQFQVALAVDEAVANVINHGYARRPDGRIWIMLWRLPEEHAGLRVVIEDEGCQVDPCKIRSRDLEDIRPGGLGVHIIREVMDECRWERRPEGGMRLVLVKHVEPPAPAAAITTPTTTPKSESTTKEPHGRADRSDRGATA